MPVITFIVAGQAGQGEVEQDQEVFPGGFGRIVSGIGVMHGAAWLIVIISVCSHRRYVLHQRGMATASNA